MGVGVGLNFRIENENCVNYGAVIFILVCVKGVRIVFSL